MLVAISDKSWSSKYYKWVMGVDASEKFKSLCPYFWTLVVLLVLFPFFAFIKSFGYVFEKLVVEPSVKRFEKKMTDPKNRIKKQSKLSEWWDEKGDTIIETTGKVLLAGFILFFVTILVLAFIGTSKKIGILMAIVWTFAGIGSIISILAIFWGIFSFFESNTWGIIKGMLYSVKNKVCPMIKWTDKPEKKMYENGFELW